MAMDFKAFDEREQEKMAPEYMAVDMSEEDKKFAIDVVREAKGTAAASITGLNTEEENKYHKDLAKYVKERFDKERGGTWHVIVGGLWTDKIGTHFGAHVSNETHKLIYFWLDHLGFLIYKHG